MGAPLSGPGAPISQNQIAKLNELISAGHTDKEAAKMTGVGIATIGRYRKKGLVIYGHGRKALASIDLKHLRLPELAGNQRIDGTIIPTTITSAFVDDGGENDLVEYKHEPEKVKEPQEQKPKAKLSKTITLKGDYVEVEYQDKDCVFFKAHLDTGGGASKVIINYIEAMIAELEETKVQIIKATEE